MGRKSTKENKSVWQTTREDLGLTREKAGELIPGFSPERIEKIENGRRHADGGILQDALPAELLLCE